MMTNQDKFTQSYTDLIDILNDLTGSMNGKQDYEDMLPDFEILDKLTTNLKRMSETGVLEKGIDINNDKKEGEVDERNI